jgi:Uma2 family endonuclease
LIIWFGIRQDEWNIEVLPEQRIRVAPGRFRIPDICVISRGQRPEALFTEPPLLCIEVLSKDDTLRSMQERIDDYTAFGIPNIWVLDPVGRQAWVCNTGEFRKPEGGVLRAEPFIHIPLTDLFAKLG